MAALGYHLGGEINLTTVSLRNATHQETVVCPSNCNPAQPSAPIMSILIWYPGNGRRQNEKPRLKPGICLALSQPPPVRPRRLGIEAVCQDGRRMPRESKWREFRSDHPNNGRGRRTTTIRNMTHPKPRLSFLGPSGRMTGAIPIRNARLIFRSSKHPPPTPQYPNSPNTSIPQSSNTSTPQPEQSKGILPHRFI